MADGRESPLRTQNVTINGRRTSVRLERSMQKALHELCERERISIHEFCTAAKARYAPLRLTAAIRSALIDYYRDAIRRCDKDG